MTDREIAINWYNDLADNKKKRVLAVYSTRDNKTWSMLTGREIEELHTKIHKIKELFLICDHGKEFFDDCDTFSTTHRMGVTHIDYNIKTKTMLITLRRPGMLIGKAGEHINRLQERLGCKIEIEESILEII